jgi:tol-pal system protein YbgF
MLAALLLGGCATWTTTEKNDLLKEMSALQREVRTLRGPTSGGGGVREQLAELTARLNSVDGRLSQLAGVDEDLNYRMAQIDGTRGAGRPGYYPPGTPGPGSPLAGRPDPGMPPGTYPPGSGMAQTPEPPPAMQSPFDEAMRSYREHRYGNAIQFFDTFIRENPGSSKLEDAYFYKGESQFAQGEMQRDQKNYEEAILTFDKIRYDYPKSKHLPSSLLRIAMSFKALGWPSDARTFLNDVIRRYPNSPEASQARQELATL